MAKCNTCGAALDGPTYGLSFCVEHKPHTCVAHSDVIDVSLYRVYSASQGKVTFEYLCKDCAETLRAYFEVTESA